MFRAPSTTPVVEPAPAQSGVTNVTPELISLVELSLSLPEPSEGWALFLGRRGISFQSDDLGRDSISRGAAKRLLDEKRAEMLRVRALHAEQEREAVEQDQARRALIWRGLPATALPVGVNAGDAMALAAQEDSHPKRQSTVAELLDGESLTFHPFTQSEDE